MSNRKSKTEAAKRRALFVEQYKRNGGNGKDAAIAAGYARKCANRQAYILLQRPDVKALIEKRNQEIISEAERETGLSIQNTLRELARMVHVDPRRFMNDKGGLKDISELDDECAAALASIDVFEEYAGRGEDRELIGYTKRIKFWDKNAAIDKAMKHLGLFKADNQQKPAPTIPVFNIIGIAGRG